MLVVSDFKTYHTFRILQPEDTLINDDPKILGISGFQYIICALEGKVIMNLSRRKHIL